MLWKCYQCWLIPLAFVALVLENELQYHGLAILCASTVEMSPELYAMWRNSSSKNLVNFCQLTPEMRGLICVRLVRHGERLAYIVEYLQIYRTDFRNLFTVWKRFMCRWWICTLFFNLSMDVFITTKKCCRNEGKLILLAMGRHCGAEWAISATHF